jgi:hypothetical protein
LFIETVFPESLIESTRNLEGLVLKMPDASRPGTGTEIVNPLPLMVSVLPIISISAETVISCVILMMSPSDAAVIAATRLVLSDAFIVAALAVRAVKENKTVSPKVTETAINVFFMEFLFSTFPEYLAASFGDEWDL